MNISTLKTLPIIKCDFDGTIVVEKFPSVGEPLEMALETLDKFQFYKYPTILWTCREGDPLLDAVDFLHQNKIYFDVVNTGHPLNPFKHLGNSRKPYANYHIDDKQIGGLPHWQVIHDYFFIEKKYHELFK